MISLCFVALALPVEGQESNMLSVSRVAWGMNLNAPVQVHPGDEGVYLTLELQNLSTNRTVKGVSGLLSLNNTVFTDIYGNPNATATGVPTLDSIISPTDEVAPKGFMTMTFNLNIDEYALPGSHLLNLQINYSASEGMSFVDKPSQTLNFTCVISASESVVVVQAIPSVVEIGEQMNVAGYIQRVIPNATLAAQSVDGTGYTQTGIENVNASLVFQDPNGKKSSHFVKTRADGSFILSYSPQIEGLWAVNSSWSGNERYSGSWALTSFDVHLPVTVETSISSSRVRAGYDNQLSVTVKDTSEVAISAINFALTIPPPLSSIGKTQWTLNYLAPGESITLNPVVFVPIASVGYTYSCVLTVVCRDTYSQIRTFSFPIGLVVVGNVELDEYDNLWKPTVIVTVTPPVLEIGGDARITGSIQPAIGITNVTLNFEDPNGNLTTQSVQTKSDGAFAFSCSPRIEGLWTVNASWAGNDRHLGNWALTSFEVRLPADLEVSLNNNRVRAGYDNQLNITVRDISEVPLSDLELKLTTPPPLSSLGKSQWSVDYLEPGEFFSFDAVVFVPSASIGYTYNCALAAVFRDSYGLTRTLTFPVDLVVAGKIELTIYNAAIEPQPASNGSEVGVTITLLNQGTVTATYVNATILPSDILELTPQSSIYIGDVEENAQTPFALEANITENAPSGVYPITLTICYRDDQKIDNSFNYTFNLHILTTYIEPEATPNDPLSALNIFGMTQIDFNTYGKGLIVAVIAIVASLILIGIYRKLRQRKAKFPTKDQ